MNELINPASHFGSVADQRMVPAYDGDMTDMLTLHPFVLGNLFSYFYGHYYVLTISNDTKALCLHIIISSIYVPIFSFMFEFSMRI